MDQSVLSGIFRQHFYFRKCLSILTRAPPQLCNLFGRECNNTEVTKNRNGRPSHKKNRNGHLATKGIGMAIWPHLIFRSEGSGGTQRESTAICQAANADG